MKIKDVDISVINGDITTLKVDAIVNAANSSLLGGGGVDGAIHRKGGSQILEECKLIRNRQGKCDTGEAVYTSAGSLHAKYIIHTVGPVWNGGNYNEPQLLSNCYLNSLLLANRLEVKSIAFPNISTGIYGYPKQEASLIAFDTVKNFIENYETLLQELYFVCFDEQNYFIYKQIINR